jgi:hypothetical protein
MLLVRASDFDPGLSPISTVTPTAINLGDKSTDLLTVLRQVRDLADREGAPFMAEWLSRAERELQVGAKPKPKP